MRKNFLIFSSMVLILLVVTLFVIQRSSGATVSNEAVGIEIQQETQQIGPQWFNYDWNYRKQVIISNPFTLLDSYHILITLNNSNFHFSFANADGSDIRFTYGNTKITLPYWIELWDKDSQLAYIWVLVPNLREFGNTSIYLYYGNPSAQKVSNGYETFDFFEDNWSQSQWLLCGTSSSIPYSDYYLSKEIDILPTNDQLSVDTGNIINFDAFRSNYIIETYPWCIITGSPSISSGTLYLDNGDGIKTTVLPGFFHQALGYKANYGSGPGHEWVGFINGTSGQQTKIGDLSSDPTRLYLMNFTDDTSSPFGVNTWHGAIHTYELEWDSNKSIGYIDHANMVTNYNQSPTTELPITLFNNNSGDQTTLQIDWVYIRKYRSPEPTIDIGNEQGLVDLSIGSLDSPDPLPRYTELTYQLTISNTSDINAFGVIVTDTIPDSVQFIRSNPPDNCLPYEADIVCNLNNIMANSSADVSIIVKPTVDGLITNTVTVGSQGYDLYLNNNIDQVVTLVDSVPPNVNWEYPVHNGMKFTTNGGPISLEASATDNDQVAWVEFWYWDHLPQIDPKGKVSIGFDYSYPYQIQFNSDELVPNEEYQVFVQAKDRAGNLSSIYTPPYPVIYVTRFFRYYTYLPLAIK